MNKKIIISINVAVIILLVGGFIFWKQMQTTPAKQPTTTQGTGTETGTQTNTGKPLKQPVTTITTVPPGMLKLQSLDGGDLLVKDFYLSPYTEIINNDNDAIIKRGESYTIEYQKMGQAFFINLEGDPKDLQTTRDDAEQALLDKLGVTKEVACQLAYVTMVVPHWISEKASGTDYGLSFCPNGIPLPKNL